MVRIILGLAAVIYWIYCLWHWDGANYCAGDCSICPFAPCEERPNVEDEADD